MTERSQGRGPGPATGSSLTTAAASQISWTAGDDQRMGAEPKVPSVEFRNALAAMTSAMRGSYGSVTLPASVAPSPAMRREMQERSRSLAASFDLGDRRAYVRGAASEIAGMLQAFQQGDGLAVKDALRRVESYAETVDGEPLWAIRKACAALKAGRYDGDFRSKAFAPSAAQLAHHVRALTSDMRAEMGSLRLALQARTERDDDTDEQREKVGKKLRQLAAGMSAITRVASPTAKGASIVPDNSETGVAAPASAELKQRLSQTGRAGVLLQPQPSEKTVNE